MPRKPSAEKSFWEAFERLKRDEPQRLPKGTTPYEANVAREAGVSPSALKKARFPTLVAAIQQWNDEHGAPSTSRSNISGIEGRQRSRSLREQIESLTAQRDAAISLLTSADARILELTLECARLRAAEEDTKVVPIHRNREKKDWPENRGRL
jgi:hypothetical protein